MFSSNRSSDIAQYEGLVFHYARQQHQRLQRAGIEHIDQNDLLQEGYVGLAEAKKRYDAKGGASFRTFADQFIRGRILDHVRKLDPLPQKTRTEIKGLDKEKEAFHREAGRAPSLRELASRLGKSEKEVEKIELSRVVLASLDELTSPAEDDSQPPMQISSDQPTPEEKVLRAALGQDVASCREGVLEKVERRVLHFRFQDELPLEATGRLLGISKDTVKRKEEAAKSKMKRCLEGKGWMVKDLVLLSM